MSFEQNRNPFYDPDDEVTDETFLNYRNPNRVFEERRDQLLEERRQVENRMLQSSNSAVRALLEAEQVGVSTAEELVRQGEQLKKVDRNLDDINNTMKTTQKHLTAMKSMFSGFKSYFGRSNTVDATSTGQAATSPDGDSGQKSQLAKIVGQVRDNSEDARVRNHPALRARVNDTSGFGAAFDDDDNDGDNNSNGIAKDGSSRTGPTLTRSQMVDRKLDNDLSEISQGLTRLKVLANGLNTELDDQLGLLNDITTKTDKAEGTIAFQNNQMNRLLKR